MPQDLFAKQTYVQDAGLFKTGGGYNWTPGKAWLNKIDQSRLFQGVAPEFSDFAVIGKTVKFYIDFE